MEDKPLILEIDLFCGAGGVTTGSVRARLGKYQPVKVIACVNHDELAIESHRRNHSNTIHFNEDIRTLCLDQLVELVNYYRRKHPEAILLLWASLECTNYSKAKGGEPRDPDSRSLPNEMFRYIDALQPDYFYYENVEEFRAWGPLDENGRPLNMKKGREYLKWCKTIKNCGYHYEYRVLNSADYGAHTKRKRLFGIFAKADRPISWPAATHSETPKQNMFGMLQPWKPVWELLNFEDEGKSLFTRSKPLVENTLKRIYAGLQKYVLNSDSLIMKYYGNGDNMESINDPAATITTKDRLCLVQTAWLDKAYTGKHNHQSIDSPAGAITTVPKMNLVSVKIPFLMKYFSGGNHLKNVDSPADTITCIDHHCLVQGKLGEDYSYLQDKDSDTPTMTKIKAFCRKHGIVDICTRMLRVPELKRIQGFGDDYYLAGTKTDQKKFIGNSVPPPVVRALLEALAYDLYESEKTAA
jgi:DNA (cytosine-5)-methyltransferase 1